MNNVTGQQLSGTVKVKLKKSLIGRKKSHVLTAKTLGLNKINSEVEHKNTPAIQGMIHKINYLVEVYNNDEVK